MAKRELIEKETLSQAMSNFVDVYKSKLKGVTDKIDRTEILGKLDAYVNVNEMIEGCVVTKSEIVKPYLERLKEKMLEESTKEFGEETLANISIAIGITRCIGFIDTMLSELEKGEEE